MITSGLPIFEEGGKCPECDGVLCYPKVEGCSCHMNPPCGRCENNRLTCDKCGCEEPEQEYPTAKTDFQKSLPPYDAYKGSEYKIAEGKRLYSVFYDGHSGSTMVFRGRIEGQVTAQEIFEALGDGTFGHRGPHVHGDGFTYTKITD
ncbi:hypothetical protein [Fimbriiglobus ruber]|uniref:hypothetical protein n=1 Tax=Fimbriiglobus ruber TaxID=1908690 RepID=UPI000B4B3DF6|nr:hypothetical protein [Fimbriiglobus ruber]